MEAVDPFIFRLAIFVLAIFVGYYVVWSVTPALHTPLMSVTNAISSVIIVGALIAAGPSGFELSKIFGLVAIALAAVNIFGGFLVTQRMLAMYKKKAKK
ncbi:MAG TPA: NAD(P) transhydrogenase subunit alpha [Alphaproteobacteria bacterium]|nr:NAD(P) transhydrogenase subunit alpha [Alphaproteobacteria bacterium]